MAADSEGKCVLVLGGTGFIGRHLVDFLVRSNEAKKIRVVDKVPPAMAWMNEVHMESFSKPVVEFKHVNLINKVSAEKAFLVENGDEHFDYVINLAAETKFGQSEPVYREGIHRLSTNCAELAAKHRVRRYVEVSTAQVYSSDKKSATEDSKLDPWTNLAHHKLEVEKGLESYVDLDYIILRPAIVYGTGDRQGLTPRIIIGSLYKYMKRKMHLLWTKDLQMNTVHVTDLVRAIWHLCHHGNRGQVYNLADKGSTSQGVISSLVSELFNINFDFLGSTFSNLARVRMQETVNEINERHMRPWSEACQRDKITNTPLTPFIDQELLYNKHLHIDGSRIEATGFSYTIPRLEVAALQEILHDYITLGLLPPSLVTEESAFMLQHNDDRFFSLGVDDTIGAGGEQRFHDDEDDDDGDGYEEEEGVGRRSQSK